MRTDSAQISVESQQKLVAARLMATFLGATLVANAYLGPALFGISVDTAGLSALCGAILLGAPVIFGSVKSLVYGRLHMQELVALAVIACFALEDYKTAGIVAFIMLCADLVQSRTALGARAAIEGLIRLTPTRARKISGSGGVVEVDALSLSAGDIIEILAGDNISADGIIEKGTATINEASITGESIPVEKRQGDPVFAGTINLDGRIEVQVTRAGEDTTLGKVKKLIMSAEQTKVPIMRIIDSYVTWYTPVILMVAGIILYFTRDMNRAVTALVVTCPAALILAAPTAVVAALSCCARLGILVKNVRNLEIASNLNALIFDKTGTLTTGELSVTKLNPVESTPDSAERLLAVAGAVAEHSTHPVSRAVAQMAKKAQVSVSKTEDIQEQAGLGVKGIVDGKEVILGKKEWLAANSVAVIECRTQSQTDGLSIIYVAYDKKFIGWIGLEDNPRKEAKSATEQLYDIGIKKIIMLTGDRESVAKKVADNLGCREYKAQCLPQEKLDMVNDLKNKGYIVGVVGDGINDAPALAAGDIGIAMGAAGSDIAIHSASISLMNNDLLRLPFIVKISRKTRSVIYQNLAFGLIFIIAGLIAAGLGYLNPVMAAVLHNLGAFAVIFNSARIVRFGEELT